MNIIRKTSGYILLVSVYGFTWLVAILGRMIPRRPWKQTGRIMVTGTIFNPNWYLSHVTPLIRSGVKEVILVIDEPLQPLEGVRFACPPRWVSRLISRAGAKAIWVLFAGFRYRPDLLMGYNLVAGSCTALIVGAVLGRPSCYQMTGGWRVLSTVGMSTFDFEKAGKVRQIISKEIERLAIHVIKQFDLIVVRGNKAKEFLFKYGIKNVDIITGSVKGVTQNVTTVRNTDLILVGRLHPIKQVDQFVEIVHRVSRVLPSIRATIVGNGDLMANLRSYSEELGLTENIQFLDKREDVEALLARSKIFILTSKAEGMSIAMEEAMMAGAVPVVADVGELGDLIRDSVNGYLIEPNNIDEYVTKIVSLLQDQVKRHQLSLRAIEASRQYCHVDVVSEKWRQSIQHVVKHSSGFNMDDMAF